MEAPVCLHGAFLSTQQSGPETSPAQRTEHPARHPDKCSGSDERVVRRRKVEERPSYLMQDFIMAALVVRSLTLARRACMRSIAGLSCCSCKAKQES